MNNVAKRISDKRSELKLSQEEMGKLLNSSQVSIGQYERGERNPKIEFYNKWSEIFGENLNTNVIIAAITKITIDELLEKSIEQQATLTVLEGMIISLAHQQSGRSIVSLIGELKKEKADEVSRILHELSRKKK